MIRVRFLGTAAARPTVSRNVSAIAVQREGESILWDCGEGSQRQIMRYGTGFSFDHIFISHAHADHFLGLPGLLRTLGLQGRDRALHIHTHPSAEATVKRAVHLGGRGFPFPVEVRRLAPGDAVHFAEWAVRAFAVDHGIPALGFSLVEAPRLGRFDVEKARALGVPEGPLFGRLHQGQNVEVDGRTITAAEVVGEARPGRSVVYSGDCRPGPGTVEAARGCDLLIHEATFLGAELERARETRHSTVTEASDVGAKAGAARVALTHISARYSEMPKVLEAEAQTVCPCAQIAYDGLEIEIPYNDD